MTKSRGVKDIRTHAATIFVNVGNHQMVLDWANGLLVEFSRGYVRERVGLLKQI